MRKIFTFVVISTAIFLSGCSQKVQIKALEPAQIDRASNTKVIAVTSFKNDSVGLSSKIESNLSQQKIDNKPFFTMVSRVEMDKIIQEQKLQNSGLVSDESIVNVGELIGAGAIISGEVSPVSSSDTYFYVKRSRCADKKCKELVYYRVSCTKRLIGISADIKMIDIEKGDIIYADSISKSATYTSCRDDSYTIPSKEIVAQKLANSIADNFTYKLTPQYRYFSVSLLEDADLDYDDTQEMLLESSIQYIKNNRYDKAETLLKRLIDSTNQQSFVAFYNLGVIMEAKGDYLKAQEYYKRADALIIEPVQEVDEAYVRINSIIKKHQKSKEQIDR